MFVGLDHIIIGVQNLTEAAHIFSERLGLAVSGGGVHPTGGTANRIIVIGDTYLELITVDRPAEAQPGMLKRLALGEGYLNCALGSDDIMADSAAMRQRGVKVIGPVAGQLHSADGRLRSWSRFDVERAEMVQSYPFVIQHDSVGEERRKRLAGWRTPPEHPLGATKILSATIAVNDLAEATRRFQHIYGLQPSEEYSGEADHWDARLVSFLLRERMQSLELAAPILLALDPVEDSPMLPQPGALAWHLQRFGESLCRMTLAVENLAAARRYLDKHGVIYLYYEGQESDEGQEPPRLWILSDQACGAAIVLHEFAPDEPESFPIHF
jgi:catechol 2,3-dioxygenase-like lactoylglutathione lyase family enzyme